MLQPDALAGFDEMVAANAAEFRVMQNQIAEFGALLDEVHLRKAFDLVVEPMKADELGESNSRVVKAQSLVKIARQ